MNTTTIEKAAEKLVKMENSSWVQSEVSPHGTITMLTEDGAPSVPIQYVGEEERNGTNYLAVAVVGGDFRLYFEKDGRRFVLRDTSLDGSVEFLLQEIVGTEFNAQYEIPINAISVYCKKFGIEI